ncbi:hypothetical protein NEF87_003524 [Candidatus Lokiarchaeum ossiferum]|uniref:Uncharacterized protein n=1 Tax=Candidatus Lokiarchaeum ossiferum TaxID=2951803 RepID=A0ABY6HXG5_9ARCH|nr:hypothetical protein NEF87_003524 [Candidatus Lokiarchaeum sp. B-35]
MVKKFALAGSVILFISWLIECMMAFNLLNSSYFLVSLQFLFSKIPGFYWQLLQILGFALYFCETIFTKRFFLIIVSILIILGKIISSIFFAEILHVNARIVSMGNELMILGFMLYLVGFYKYRNAVQLGYYILVSYVVLLLSEIFVLYFLQLSQSAETAQIVAAFWNLGLLTLFIFHGIAITISKNAFLEVNEEEKK